MIIMIFGFIFFIFTALMEGCDPERAHLCQQQWSLPLFGVCEEGQIQAGGRDHRCKAANFHKPWAPHKTIWKLEKQKARVRGPWKKNNSTCKKRSRRAELCSGPWPSYPWGRRRTNPVVVIHFSSPDAMKLSIIDCALFVKSPNCKNRDWIDTSSWGLWWRENHLFNQVPRLSTNHTGTYYNTNSTSTDIFTRTECIMFRLSSYLSLPYDKWVFIFQAKPIFKAKNSSLRQIWVANKKLSLVSEPYIIQRYIPWSKMELSFSDTSMTFTRKFTICIAQYL